MRFVFPMSLRVITYSLLPSSPNHTGVSIPVPVLRNVVSEMYFCPAMGEGIGLAMANIVAGLRPAYVHGCGLRRAFRLAWLVRKWLCGLLLSCNLCYKPEHA